MFRIDTLGVIDTTSVVPIAPNRQSIGAGGTFAINLSAFFQTLIVKSTGGAVAASSTPFGASAPLDGTVVWIIGDDSTNTVEFDSAAYAAGGKTIYCAGTKYITQLGDACAFMYCKVIDQWVKVAQS